MTEKSAIFGAARVSVLESSFSIRKICGALSRQMRTVQ